MISEIRNETGTQKLVGYVIEVGHPDGTARCWLDLDERHLNRHNVLHGGIATMLLDSASGAAGSLTVDNTGRAPFLTVSLTTQFVASGKLGRVTAVGRVTGGGRSLKYITAELHHGDGTLIATSTGVFKRVPEEKLP
jgi:acyl-coenzyme A thioesterase 13